MNTVLERDASNPIASPEWSGAAPARPRFRHNRFLAALPAQALNRLIPALKLVSLVQNRLLFERGEAVRTVYFPNDAVVSLSNVTESGASTELLLVGVEGIVGTSVLMRGASSSRAVVQSSGTAYQIESVSLLKEFDRHGEFLGMALRYMQSVITQTAQSAVCYRHHSIDQQLCRWLLHFSDRVPSNRVSLTHELIANTLGVRREGVTTAALNLKKRGVIDYCRGHLTVIDRRELEMRSCECYEVVVKENNRLLPECRTSVTDRAGDWEP